MELSRGYHKGFIPDVFDARVKAAADRVREYKIEHPDFTHIVGTGISGQAICWALSQHDLTGVGICIVRKREEVSRYSEQSVYGIGDLKEFMIIDDLIETGRTIETIIGTIWRYYNDWKDRHHRMYAKHLKEDPWFQTKPVPKAVLLYNEQYAPRAKFHECKVHDELVHLDLMRV